jgi:hypothetical protein
LELVSDTEPFSDSSGSSFSSSRVPYGANYPAPSGPSRASTRATNTDGSETGLEPVRQKTKKRIRDTDSSDSADNSRTAGSKRRKTSEEAYRNNKLYRKAIEQESADERAAAQNKKKTKKQAIREQEDLEKRDP